LFGDVPRIKLANKHSEPLLKGENVMRTASNAAISGIVAMLGMLNPGTVQAAEINVLAG
jgi:hypothetical protein